MYKMCILNNFCINPILNRNHRSLTIEFVLSFHRAIRSNVSSHFFQIRNLSFTHPNVTRSRNCRKWIRNGIKKEKKNINQKEKKQVYTRLKLRRLRIEISSIRLEFSHFGRREGERRRKEESVSARKMEMSRSGRGKNENKMKIK